METHSYVKWFRASSPYIHAFRGKTFVIYFGGEMAKGAGFSGLLHDIALLSSLGIKIIIVHGARPQITAQLAVQKHRCDIVEGLRVTDEKTLLCVKQANGTIRSDIEALLSMGLAASPQGETQVKVVSGNFVTAQPVGIKQGVDFGYTGTVRRVDSGAIAQHLNSGSVVLISAMGYSPTGETFNVSSIDLAAKVANAVNADKLIALVEENPIPNTQKKPHIKLEEVASYHQRASEEGQRLLMAITACGQAGVRRMHIIDQKIEGGLLLELFTREGVGVLVTGGQYEGLRQATINDVGGVLDLIGPLEEQGALVKRSREKLEVEISYFTVAELDGLIVGCAALYPSAAGMAELACLVIHPDYMQKGYGQALLEEAERLAAKQEARQLFVLTTQASHWFKERGFVDSVLEQLPKGRQALYNYQRNSKVLIKSLAL